MKVVNSDRSSLYHILNACFISKDVNPVIAELGVLKGENAMVMHAIFQPKKLYLIDSWSSKNFLDYKNNNSHRSWVDDLDTYDYYFNGPPSNQLTMDLLYEGSVDKFKGFNSVEILRMGTIDGFKYLSDKFDNKPEFNLIYVDASHQYETVIDDLMLYKDLLGENGAIQLNDCCHSALGVKQNLGVLEAVVKFTKMTDFVPVAITNTDWSDVVLVRRNGPMMALIDRAIDLSDLSYVEIPPQLLGALKVRYGHGRNLSFY